MNEQKLSYERLRAEVERRFHDEETMKDELFRCIDVYEQQPEANSLREENERLRQELRALRLKAANSMNSRLKDALRE